MPALRIHETPPTDRQREVLRFIAEHIVEHQRPPTRKEIAAHFGWSSPNAAEEHIQSLTAKGYLLLDAAQNHHERYVRVRRWPEGLPPVLRVAVAA